jgi:hypothetical protein
MKHFQGKPEMHDSNAGEALCHPNCENNGLYLIIRVWKQDSQDASVQLISYRNWEWHLSHSLCAKESQLSILANSPVSQYIGVLP